MTKKSKKANEKRWAARWDEAFVMLDPIMRNLESQGFHVAVALNKPQKLNA